ncbi:TIGR02285 family protein [Bdellovibrio svalbardensis]|uniref:TIGR02285 family protein n=1 Tax=Bdellovibrio svalbardensis TaxID=2972972 RepID=A0ABT6DN66_9BACT|nr:TIGR02285 family protein [Bdellovibrio svalbardensis]MDG0818233.1 TIGR02285 family protein [Bdellovibrio svalbardensis]
MLFWLLLLITSSHPANAKERIIWYKPSWPPYFEATGPRTGQGFIDQLLNYLQDEIQSEHPEVQFESTYYALGTLEQMRLQKPNTCNVSHLRTPDREKIAYFTALYIQPPPQLVFREADWKTKLFEAKVISLSRLLDEKNLHGGFSTARSYGTALDAIIASRKKNSTVEIIPGSPESSSLLNMLSAQKFDFTLEYEEVVNYLESNKMVLGRFALAEAEEQRSAVVVHIACSKTEWGRKTILLLDSTLQRLANTVKFKRLMENWHSPALRNTFRKDFDEFYKTRAGAWTNATTP